LTSSTIVVETEIDLLQNPKVLVEVQEQLFILSHYGMTWKQIQAMGIHEIVIEALSSAPQLTQSLESSIGEVTSDNAPSDKTARTKLFEPEIQPTSIELSDDDDEFLRENYQNLQSLKQRMLDRQLQMHSKDTIFKKMEEKRLSIQMIELEMSETARRRDVTDSKIQKLKPMVESMQKDLVVVNNKLNEFSEKKKLIQSHLEPLVKELLDDNQMLMKEEQQLISYELKKRKMAEELDVLGNQLASFEDKTNRAVTLEVPKQIQISPFKKIEYFSRLKDGSFFCESDMYLPKCSVSFNTVADSTAVEPSHYSFIPREQIAIISKLCAFTRNQANQFTPENYEIMLSYRPDEIDAWLGYATYFLNQPDAVSEENAKSVIAILDRAVEKNPSSIVLWTVYLEFVIRVYKSNSDDIRIVFSRALQHHRLSPHLYWMYYTWETDPSLRIDFLIQSITNFLMEPEGTERTLLSLFLFNCAVQLLIEDSIQGRKLLEACIFGQDFVLDRTDRMNLQSQACYNQLLSHMESSHRCSLVLIHILHMNLGYLPHYLFFDSPDTKICSPSPFLIREFENTPSKPIWSHCRMIILKEASVLQLCNEPHLACVLLLNLYHIEQNYGLTTYQSILDELESKWNSLMDCTELLRLKALCIANVNGLGEALEFMSGTRQGWPLLISGLKLLKQVEHSSDDDLLSWLFEIEMDLQLIPFADEISPFATYVKCLHDSNCFDREDTFLTLYRILLVASLQGVTFTELHSREFEKLVERVVDPVQNRLIRLLYWFAKKCGITNQNADDLNSFVELFQLTDRHEPHPFTPIFSFKSQVIAKEVSYTSFEHESLFEVIEIDSFSWLAKFDGRPFFTPSWCPIPNIGY
jgi:hypothetical protein